MDANLPSPSSGRLGQLQADLAITWHTSRNLIDPPRPVPPPPTSMVLTPQHVTFPVQQWSSRVAVIDERRGLIPVIFDPGDDSGGHRCASWAAGRIIALDTGLGFGFDRTERPFSSRAHLQACAQFFEGGL